MQVPPVRINSNAYTPIVRMESRPICWKYDACAVKLESCLTTPTISAHQAWAEPPGMHGSTDKQALNLDDIPESAQQTDEAPTSRSLINDPKHARSSSDGWARLFALTGTEQ